VHSGCGSCCQYATGHSLIWQPCAPARTAPAGQGLLARRPLVSFFIMAYAFSWLVWSPWVLGQDGAGLLPFKFGHAATVVVLAAGILAGPTLSAFIMTATTEGREGVRRLLARYVLWRVGIRWYLFALIGVPVIMLLGTMAYAERMPNLGALGGPSYVLFYLGGFVLTLILGGPLLEEGAGGASRFPAWSGFTGRSSRRLSWACCGPCGTCRSSWSRPGPPHLAVAVSLA
jgi:hypothetical protein